jgi:glycosyltransferase involved in cell wall biosynthesis
MKRINFLVLDITLKGGIERFVANMASSFVERNFNVTIYSFHRSNDKLLYNIHPNVSIIYLTKFRFLKHLYKLVAIFCSLKLSKIGELGYKDNFFISTSPIITIYLSWFAHKFLSRTIASEHSTYGTHGKWIRAMRLKYYSGVKCVVTQTNDGVRHFADAGLPTAKIVNGCANFSDRRQWTVSDKALNGPFICLSVGRFEAVKQLDHYIQMALLIHHRYPNIRFELVGAGPLEIRLRNQIDLYKLSHVFSLHPPTLHINEFYARASVYIITSKSEAFPMTMIEALSFGLPVISYDSLIGPREVIVNGYNGFLCIQDEPRDLAEKVIKLHDDRGMLKILQNNSLFSSISFKQEKIMDDWLKVLMSE